MLFAKHLNVPFLLFFLTLCLFSLVSSLPELLAKTTNDLHILCLKLTHLNGGESTILRKAVLCGARPQNKKLIQLFKQSGLLHLLIISGAHLNILDLLIRKIMFLFPRAKIYISYIGLISLTLICQFQAPCLRALNQKSLSHLNKRQKLFLSPPHIVLYSGLFSLSLKPQLIFSQSLILSWLISLILTTPKINSLKKCLLIYLALLPWQLHFMNMSPLSILSNWLVAPILSSVMLPLAIIETSFPISSSLTQFFWDLILKTLESIQEIEFSTHRKQSLRIHISIYWTYLCLWQIYYLRRSLWNSYKNLSS